MPDEERGIVADVASQRIADAASAERRTREEAVDYILEDCFLAFGQAVGDRKSVRREAVIWLRQHYRERFLGALHRFGNRWLLDRQTVINVGFLLGDRAVRHSGFRPEIDSDAARRAAKDVERYCTIHGRRQSRGRAQGEGEPLRAGTWCMPYGSDL
jgi:hypothetical protein